MSNMNLRTEYLTRCFDHFLLTICSFGTVWIYCTKICILPCLTVYFNYGTQLKVQFRKTTIFCKCFYQTNMLRKKCFFGTVQEMSEENNLWFLFDYFAEAKTNPCCSIVCSRCQKKKTNKAKLSAALRLNAVFTKENKDKAI